MTGVDEVLRKYHPTASRLGQLLERWVQIRCAINDRDPLSSSACDRPQHLSPLSRPVLPTQLLAAPGHLRRMLGSRL